MIKKGLLLLAAFMYLSVAAQQDIKLKKKDRKRDIEVVTTEGIMVLRLSDSTPEHRDNFLRLVKSHFYDSVLFHRVIKNFMIQTGDPGSIRATAGQPLGNGGPAYTIKAEMTPLLFHKKGALAAARKGDNVNPERSSSGSQFYIVHGQPFTNQSLDSIEAIRLQGRKIPAERRAYYTTVGGTPQLDANYTVFGETISGLEVIDKIAMSPTSMGRDRDRPLTDVRIISMRLIKRKK